MSADEAARRAPLARLWMRTLWQRPRRALATVLGVAVGVAAVLSTGLASRAAVASMTDDVEALAGRSRLEVTRPGGVPVTDLGRLAPLCDEVEVAAVVEGTALLPGSGELVRLLGIESSGADERLGALPAEVGARFLRREGCVVANSAAQRLGLARGAQVELLVQARRIDLEVLATFEPERLASAWERVLIVDVALAQELLERRAHVDRVELTPRAGLTLDERVIARAHAVLPEGYRVAPPSTRRAEGEHLVRSLTFNLTALSGVSVLVAIVLVATTLATSVVERRAVIALLRSLGASRAQLATAILCEAGLLGLAGGALGVALGWGGARIIAVDVHGAFATLSEDVLLGAVRFDPRWALAGILLGVASALAAAFLPLSEAWRTPPIQNLRSAHEARALHWPDWRRRGFASLALGLAALWTARLPAWNERPIWALVSTLLWLAILIVLAEPVLQLLARTPTAFLGERLGTPVRLAQAALAAAQRRAAWAASAVGVAVALAVAMSTMIGSFRANVVEWTGEILRADLYLRPRASAEGTSAGKIPPAALALVSELFGSDRVDPYRECAAEVKGESVRLGGATFAIGAREGDVPFLDGRAPGEVLNSARERHGVLANEPFARRFGLTTGDRVRITAAKGTREHEIVGVYRDYSGHLGRLVLDREDYLRLAEDEGAESVDVFLADDANIAAERARLHAALAGHFELEVLDNRELRAEILRVFERTFAVTSALQGIAALVAALAVVLVLTALVRERERELAVVRVLGGSRLQLGALVAGQAAGLGLAGTLGGLGLGLVVGYVLVTVINVQSFGWSLRFVLLPSVFWSAALVLPACLMAGWIPAWLSQRLQPQVILREPD